MHPEIAGTVGAERFLQEIQIAAQLTHPNILTLIDSGEAAGLLYYVMPYVEGESLRARLEREGRLEIDEVISIASEVADALGYAHQHDVVHRDIKPGNILLADGHAYVADFGIARAVAGSDTSTLTDTGFVVGSPAYMSPEQLMDEELDGRADLYALGCVLYEMLAGERLYSGSSMPSSLAQRMVEPPPSVRETRADVPADLDAVVLKALSAAPEDRFGTAADLERALARRRSLARPQRMTLGAGVVAAGVALLAFVFGQFVSNASASPFQERDWVLLTPFVDETGEDLGPSLQQAFVTSLEQSTYVNVLPRNRVVAALGRLGEESSADLTGELGLELARAEGVRAVLLTRLGRDSGGGYAISLDILDSDSGDPLYETLGERVAAQDYLIAAMDAISGRVRRVLGESPQEIIATSVDIEPAATSSLEALRNFVQGNEAWNTGSYEEAGRLWQLAIEKDSAFARAHANLGGYYYYWGSDRPAGDRHFDIALSLRDRLTERERLVLEANVQGYRGDYDGAVTTLRVYLRNYPDDAGRWYNLANHLRGINQPAEAIEAYDRSIELDSNGVWAHTNRAITLTNLGSTASTEEEANDYFQRSLAGWQRVLELDSTRVTQLDLNRMYGTLLLYMGDLEGARSTFEAMLEEEPRKQGRGHRNLGLLLTYQGRYSEANEHFAEAARFQQSVDQPLSELRDRLYLATAQRTAGDEVAMRRELDRVWNIQNEAYLAPAWLDKAGEIFAQEDMLERARRSLALIRERSNEGNVQDQGAGDRLEGEILLAEGRAIEALEPLELAEKRLLDNQGLESLARGQRLAGDIDRAIETYERLIQKRLWGWEAQEPWVIARYWLGRLYEEKGDREAAARWYRSLLELWRDGDPDLPLRVETENRLAQISG
jgi:serine/threonine-protein kinase